MDQAPTRRPVRSYVLRGGRMGSGQQRALAELGPRLVLPFTAQPLDFNAAFGRSVPVIMEIGFGMGDATAQVAAATPAQDFIGVEVHEAGIGALLKRIGDADLHNLRIVRHDAVDVLRQMIPPAALAGVHIWFPDPWHKKRHHKRRLIQPAFVTLLQTRLQPGGYLHCATDWQDYPTDLQVLSVGTGWSTRRRRHVARLAPLTIREPRHPLGTVSGTCCSSPRLTGIGGTHDRLVELSFSLPADSSV